MWHHLCLILDASGQHGLGVSDADQVVRADGPPHGRPAQVLVLVLTQPGDGLETAQTQRYYYQQHKKVVFH